MTILVTGVAGFIGFHVARALLEQGEPVVGIDNLNAYYCVALKEARLAQLESPNFRFRKADISVPAEVEPIFAANRDCEVVIHLAAQPGIRHSMVDPYSYVAANVMGHVAVLEGARRMPALRHLVYASSSSVYGLNASLPSSEADTVSQPTSLYAATKLADELISHSYAHLHGLPQTGMRFFTVYGPWGRPDMAYYSFARAIVEGRPITLYEGQNLARDFTYVDDIVTAILGIVRRPPPAEAPARIINVGGGRREPVASLIAALEEHLGTRAIIEMGQRPRADVEQTAADTEALKALTGSYPTTRLQDGIARFARWFMDYEGRALLTASARGG